MIEVDVGGHLRHPTVAQDQNAERRAMSFARAMPRRWLASASTSAADAPHDQPTRPGPNATICVAKNVFAPTCAIASGTAQRSDWSASLARAWLLDSGWSHGVTVSTLDSESSDRGSNPRETFDRAIYSARRSRGTPLEHVDIVRRALVEDVCATAAGTGVSMTGVGDGVKSALPDRPRWVHARVSMLVQPLIMTLCPSG